MAGAPAVSVAIIACNSAESLPRTLDSLRRQSFGDFELLLVDDGSTDRTWSLVTDLDWPRLRAHRNTARRGEAAAFNQALEWAVGDYFAFIAAGDMLAGERLEKQLALLNRHDSVVAVSTAVGWVDAQGRTLRHVEPPTNHTALLDWLVQEDIYAPSLAVQSVMFRREAVEAAGGCREAQGLAAGVGLWLRLGQDGKLTSLPETLHSVPLDLSAPIIQEYARLRAYTNLVRRAPDGEARPETGMEEGGKSAANEPSPVAVYYDRMSLFARRAERADNYLHWAKQFEAWDGPAASYIGSLWAHALSAWPLNPRVWEFAMRLLKGGRNRPSAGPSDKDDGNAE